MTADVRYALRGLRRQPLWTAAAALTLALGIGANAAMFSVVDRLLVAPPAHLDDPAHLQRIGFETSDRRGGTFLMTTTSWPAFERIRANPSLAGAAAVADGDMVLGTGAAARSVQAAKVSGDYFTVLGAHPIAGRWIDASDTEPAVVVSYALARSLFGGQRSAVGGELALDGVTYRVVGVAPADFTGDQRMPVDVWVPIDAAMGGTPEWRTSENMRLVRIIVRTGLAGTAGMAGNERIVLDPVAPGWRALANAPIQARIALWVAAMSVVVLLIAVVNVANLVIFRAQSRRREMAVRMAIGAGRAQLARQLLVESLVVAALGGVLALAVAAWGSEAMRAFLLPQLAPTDTLLSLPLVAATAVLTIAAGVMTGLLPAVRAGRHDLGEDLRTGGGASGRRSRAPAVLVAGQSSLSLVLLAAAALFVISLARVRGQDFGFRTDGVLVATMKYPQGAPGSVTDPAYREALERVRAIPGVARASLAQVVPFSSHNVPPIAVPGRPEFPDESQQAPFLNAATPEYFGVLGMRVLDGRNFTSSDREGSELVIIINQAMAQGLWPGESAIGKCVRVGFAPGEMPTSIHASPAVPCRTVVGVVNNARPRSVREEAGQARMQYYVPFGQIPKPPFAAAQGMGEIWGLLIKTVDDGRGRTGAVAEQVQRTLQSFQPGLPLAEVRPLQELLDVQMRPWLLGAAMFTVFGGLALLLGAVGLYGVRAYAVAQRTREIGVRIALGANAKVVVRMVLLEGLRVTLIGAAIGAAAVLLLARFLEPLLFETDASSPVVLALVVASLAGVSVLASAIPAWRAARVDPNVALRSE